MFVQSLTVTRWLLYISRFSLSEYIFRDWTVLSVSECLDQPLAFFCVLTADARAAEPSSTQSVGCELSRAPDAYVENCTRSRRHSGGDTALTTALMTKCLTALSWTPETVYWEPCRAHCTNEVQVLLYPRRTRYRGPSVEVLCESRETEEFLFFYILPHLREMGTETIIQLPKSRGFIMIPIYPSLSSTKWQPGPTDKYRQSTLTHLHINTLSLTDVK